MVMWKFVMALLDLMMVLVVISKLCFRVMLIN